MKRLLLVLAMVCLATGAFATDVSFGIGASASYYSSDFTESFAGLTGDSAITKIPFNFIAYADMTYLQVAVGYRMFRGAHEKDTNPISGVSETDFNRFSASYVSFAAYGKFPLQLGSVIFFPMIGVEYDMVIAGTYNDGTAWTSQTKSDQSEFWIKGGIGLDVPVSPQLYVRPELILGYKLLNKPEKDLIDSEKSLGAYDVSYLDLSVEFALLLGVRL